MSSLNADLTDQIADLVEGLKQSLVIVQGTRFGAGAGILLSEDGLILTNTHVVGRNTNPTVTLVDDRKFEARLLARDPEVDLAMIKINAKGLTPVKMGDSTKTRVGELVIAIGHPWGQRNDVTAGVISHLTSAETRGRRGLIPVIRTDARLAPGNSGGPLVNAAGEVLGINTLIVGGDQSVAIPTAVAKDLLENLPQDMKRGAASKTHNTMESFI